jgi:hypothetical protein
MYSSNGVDFEVVGFVEKPCITHYKHIRGSEICRECSPGRFWNDPGDGHSMLFSSRVELEEWTEQWMDSM